MSIISPYALINSIRTVNHWQASVNANMVGATKSGYKAMDVMFGGGLTTTIVPQRGNQLGVALPEDTIRVGHTYIDFTQGDITLTETDTHYAIDGQGFFMVADQTGKVFYTRNGEFIDNGKGQLVNAQGLTLVDKAVAINMGLYNSATPTVTDIDNDNTGWVNMGSNLWVPYVAGTKYDEGTSYQNMTVNAKKTFFVDGGQLTGNESISISTDNEAYVIVNGNLLDASDVTSGPYPSTYNATTVYNIGPYLVNGANTILIQTTEHGGGEKVQVTADTVAGVDLTTNGGNYSTWAVETNPLGTVAPATSPAPNESRMNTILSTDVKDMILALPPSLQDMAYSKFSSLFFEYSQMPITSIPLSLPGFNGFGEVYQKHLESSNVDMAKSITNLTGVKSMSDVLAKQFGTFISQVDIGINLIV